MRPSRREGWSVGGQTLVAVRVAEPFASQSLQRAVGLEFACAAAICADSAVVARARPRSRSPPGRCRVAPPRRPASDLTSSVSVGARLHHRVAAARRRVRSAPRGCRRSRRPGPPRLAVGDAGVRRSADWCCPAGPRRSARSRSSIDLTAAMACGVDGERLTGDQVGRGEGGPALTFRA